MSPALLTRSCPVCGGGAADVFAQKGSVRLVRCATCSMVFANPVPAEFARGDYYNDTAAEYYLSPAKLESDYAEVRFERELRLFRQFCRGGAVLDVGCSTGAFLFQILRRFPGDYRAAGMDASGPALHYAQSRDITTLAGDFVTHDFGGELFSAVTFWAVLEHVAEPRTFIQKCWHILKSDGLCFVLVPNLESLAARLLGVRYRYIYPQHLNYFTRMTLRRIAEERFTVVATRSTHFNPLVLWQDWRRGGGDVSNAERARLLQRTTAYKQAAWLKPIKALYRLTEAFLGKLYLADNLVMVLRKQSRNL